MKKCISKSVSLTLILAFAKQVAMTDALHRWATACSALSSSSRSSRMVFKGIMCFALIVFFVSCRSMRSIPTTKSNDSVTFVHEKASIDTIYLRDSVFISERQRGDTVYLTRTEWRDRWRTRIERDTVVDVRVEKEVVQLPPERYVPKFYKWCTGLLFAIGLSAFGYWLLKWWLTRYL